MVLAATATLLILPWALDVAVRAATGIAGAGGEALSAASIDGVTAGRTLAYAAGIGVVSSILALPGAWLLRERGAAWAPLLLVPTLFPPYLAYSGWSLLRAPGTVLGDALMRAPEGVALEVGRWMGAGGLVLWAWPLAALVITLGDMRIADDWIDALRLHPIGRWRLRLELLRMRMGSVVLAACVVGLVMLGSAVPMHLAQINTLAIQLWSDLAEMSDADQWRVWVRGWPLIAVAIVAAVLLSRLLARPSRLSTLVLRRRDRSVSIGCRLAVAGAWILSVVVPVGLFALDVGSVEAVRTFWRVHREAVETSLLVGLGVGVAGAVLALLGSVAFGTGGGARRIAAVVLGAFAAAALLPGVMVGSATLGAWNRWNAGAWLVDSPAIVAVGHLARFAVVPLLVGAWVARLEPPEARDLRELYGVRGLVSRARGGLLGPLVPAAAGAGLLVFALSVHEVEAAVLLAPPGHDTFARRMLEFLHFTRFEPLAIGSVGIVVLATGAAVGASLGLSIAARQARLARLARSDEPPGR